MKVQMREKLSAKEAIKYKFKNLKLKKCKVTSRLSLLELIAL